MTGEDRLREFLEDPELPAAIRDAIGRQDWGDLRSERAKEAYRQLFIPHSEAVVKMLKERAGITP